MGANLTNINREEFELFGRKFLNLKQYCKLHNGVDIYFIYKKLKNNKQNVILEFAFELMQKLGVNKIEFKDFSTKTLNNGIICATLFDKTLFEIYFKHYKNNDFIKG